MKTANYDPMFHQVLAPLLRDTFEVLRVAMETGHVVAFTYDGKTRVAEVHAIGMSTKGELVVRAVQIGGEASRPLPQWTLFTLNKIVGLDITPAFSQAPREGYVQGDKQMSPVLIEIEL